MILAIDIGGTKTLLGLFDERGKLVKTKRFETPTEYQDFVSLLRESVTGFTTKPIKQCVAAVPGKLDRMRGIAEVFGNLPWRDVPIASDIAKITGAVTHIENDARLAGLGEAVLLPQYHKVLYITVSTGIGSSLVVDGKLDPNHLDAEVGHMMLEHRGKIQTWESFASGKAIYNHFGKKASELDKPSEWYIVARNIAIGLINVIATTTPEAVVIGGGVGTHLPKFQDRLEEELLLYKSDIVNIPTILPAKNPEEAVLYGAYELSKNYS